MRPSSIELERYFVTDLNVSANPEFEEGESTGLSIEDLSTEPECFSEKEDKRHWMIHLKVKNTAKKESNTPYYFSVTVVGFFKIHNVVSDENVGDFAKINGASILYGTAREVLRNVMSMGPHGPILLPAVCFLDAVPEAGDLPAKKDRTPTARGRKTRERKTPATGR